ncbi:MAG TPA: hypothetical protein VNE62_13180 [Actinomycetota bacterium]|nr:hypothetical protein [Actinomycetota bacterium]
MALVVAVAPAARASGFVPAIHDVFAEPGFLPGGGSPGHGSSGDDHGPPRGGGGGGEPESTPGPNSNPIDPYAEPLEYIEILIVPSAVGPQFLYNGAPRHPIQPVIGRDNDALMGPLGYFKVAPQKPVTTQVLPRTYWVRSIQNLDSKAHTVVPCTADRESDRCSIAGGLYGYPLAPGETMMFHDPATGRDGAFPPEPMSLDQTHYMTVSDDRHARAAFILEYYDLK